MVKYGRTVVTRLPEDSLAASKLLLSVSIRAGLPAIFSVDARSLILGGEELILVHLTLYWAVPRTTGNPSPASANQVERAIA